MTELRWANIHGRIVSLLVVCCVKMGITIMSSWSIEESLVASVWMHKGSTGQMMNQVMTPLQQRFGKPCLCRATLSVWEKVCLCRGIWRILLRAVDQDPERGLEPWLPLSLNDHHTSLCGNVHRNLEYYLWPCLTPQEGPGDEVILASVDNWTQWYWHESMSQSMCFVVGMISGSLVSWESSLSRWMCSLLQLPILKCFLGLKT